jgi:uncharacterized membrane protein (UPF0127 family)
VAIRNRSKGTVLATHDRWATEAADRMRGLLDRDGLDDGEALVLSPCNSVHMFGMTFPLDVVFVARDRRVVRVVENLKPWRFTRIHFCARHTIELPVGAVRASRTEAGDVLEWDHPLPGRPVGRFCRNISRLMGHVK